MSEWQIGHWENLFDVLKRVLKYDDLHAYSLTLLLEENENDDDAIGL
jgi:Trp operon repressor